MFAVSAAETIRLARSRHFRTVLNIKTESAQRANQQKGVTWSWLAFAKVIGETNFNRSDQSVGGHKRPFDTAFLIVDNRCR